MTVKIIGKIGIEADLFSFEDEGKMKKAIVNSIMKNLKEWEDFDFPSKLAEKSARSSMEEIIREELNNSSLDLNVEKGEVVVELSLLGVTVQQSLSELVDLFFLYRGGDEIGLQEKKEAALLAKSLKDLSEHITKKIEDAHG